MKALFPKEEEPKNPQSPYFQKNINIVWKKNNQKKGLGTSRPKITRRGFHTLQDGDKPHPFPFQRTVFISSRCSFSLSSWFFLHEVNLERNRARNEP